ncbi:MAG TPA: carboxymuconolactone decarboxylase family protein [Gemmatimonadaceae bacterium]|nr:carboxymuconolactone decarboxylase family protein [Gemmatimonadaceae bacterium]
MSTTMKTTSAPSAPSTTAAPTAADTRPTLRPRIKSPAGLLPDVMAPIQALLAATRNGSVSPAILELSHIRASQINGCGFCVDIGSRHAKEHGETDVRLFGVAAWRESPHFTNAERAALALTEAITRIADHPDSVSDEIWNEAAKYFDERGLATLVLSIAVSNLFNHCNVPTRQLAGSWK